MKTIHTHTTPDILFGIKQADFDYIPKNKYYELGQETRSFPVVIEIDHYELLGDHYRIVYVKGATNPPKGEAKPKGDD